MLQQMNLARFFCRSNSTSAESALGAAGAPPEIVRLAVLAGDCFRGQPIHKDDCSCEFEAGVIAIALAARHTARDERVLGAVAQIREGCDRIEHATWRSALRE